MEYAALAAPQIADPRFLEVFGTLEKLAAKRGLYVELVPFRASVHIPRRAFKRGDAAVDPVAQKIVWRGRIVRLMPSLFPMAALLIWRAGEIVSGEELYRTCFPGTHTDEAHRDIRVRVNMTRIRKVFRKADPEFDRISTFRHKGYQWVPSGS